MLSVCLAAPVRMTSLTPSGNHRLRPRLPLRQLEHQVPRRSMDRHRGDAGARRHLEPSASFVSHPIPIPIPGALVSLTAAQAKYFRWIFYLSTGSVLLDFVLNMVWLPIATSKTYGFRSPHDAFMTTYNGTGAPAGWNWCLSYLATAGILIGFDASGHVAEETKNASVSAARGIFWSTVVSGVGGFSVVILFLFCVVSGVWDHMSVSHASRRLADVRPSPMRPPSSPLAVLSRLCRCTQPFSAMAGTSS